jgi:riboflavin transporter FmnP
MKTKTLATTIVFAALTVALNPAVSGIGIAAPYAPFLIYGLWEIPIVAAFLLISATAGIAISLLNAVVLFVFFPGALPTGPLYNLIALFSMLLGVYLGRRFFAGKPTDGRKVFKVAAASTILGIVLRVAVMSLVNYVTLPQSYPIGFNVDPMVALTFYVPATDLFNASVALYTVPIGEFIADVVRSRLKLNIRA